MRKKDLFLKNILTRAFFFPFEIFWLDIDLIDLKELHRIFSFLQTNYVEDCDSVFRFYYQHELLAMTLLIPKWNSFLILGIKFCRGKKLLGLMPSIPKKIIFREYIIDTSEINYLCILKKIRNKKLVSSIVQEMTRRLNLFGVSQAIYTTAICFFRPFLTCRYYHYFINRYKLFKYGFSKDLDFTTSPKNIFFKFKKSIHFDLKNLNWYISTRRHLTKFQAYKYFTNKDFYYSFRIFPGIFYVFTLKKEKRNNLKIFSFYSLSNKIIFKNKNALVLTSYWYFGFFKIFLKISCRRVIENVIKLGFDLFNVMESFSKKPSFLRWNFKKGSGRLQFQIFNWKIKRILPKENSLIFF